MSESLFLFLAFPSSSSVFILILVFICLLQQKYKQVSNLSDNLCTDDGFFLACKYSGGMFDHSFSASAFFVVLFCFEVDISSRTLIALFRPGSVHSGIASYDDCGWVFPDIYALIHCIYALVYSLNHLCLWLYVEGRIKELLYPFVCGIILYHPAPPFN